MKLTLSSSGGFTGLSKESTIDLDSLDEKTRTALMRYFASPPDRSAGNINENWTIDGDREAFIHTGKMDDQLLKLYESMRSNLAYKKM